MLVQIFPSGPYFTNAYVAACENTREAAVIDPAPDSAKKILKYVEQNQLILKKILLTHSHWDHIADIKGLKDHAQLPVFIHPLDAPNLQSPGADGLPFSVQIPPIQPDVLLEDGMQISIGNLSFSVLHTPGHSPGCVCFYESQQKILFSGDTLFKGTIGNLSFPTSQPSLMLSSLEKIAKLPKETRIYPGHGPATTIAAESSWLFDAKNQFSL